MNEIDSIIFVLYILCVSFNLDDKILKKLLSKTIKNKRI